MKNKTNDFKRKLKKEINKISDAHEWEKKIIEDAAMQISTYFLEGINSIKIKDATEHTFRQLEIFNKKSDKENPERTAKIDCKKGCSYCCYNIVELNVFEAITINEFLHENFEEGDIDKIYEVTNNKYNLTKDFNKEDDTFQVRFPCPFLNIQTGECKIYQVRPFTCRGFNSSDSNKCKKSFENPSLKIPINMNAFYKYSSSYFQTALELVLKIKKYKNSYYRLETIMKEFLENPELPEEFLQKKSKIKSLNIHEGINTYLYK